MRAILSFDLDEILPDSDHELEIKYVILRIYKANTNLAPFDGEGGDRTFEASMLDFGLHDTDDYN